jgi:3-oxoacyl-[acyl-carrier-protein] synthase II
MRIAITQSDLATAYGWGLDSLWNGLLTGQTAIRPTQRFAERNFVSDQAAIIPDLRPDPGESLIWTALKRLLSPIAGKLDPATPLILATTVGEIEFIERSILEENPALAEQSSPRFLLERVKKLLRLNGPACVLSSACASSTAALTRAAAMVRHGQAKSVLVVTGDAVSEFVYSGFSSLLSLCPTPAQPFDRERCGLTLGEAVAWALVTATESKESLSILGWGNTTDAIHMTAPDRNAGGLSRAIAKSLKMSGQNVEEIGLIAAHGTGTVYSDAMEIVAFRGAIPSPRPVFSVKGGIGHTLAAAGLVQILVAGRAMAKRMAPPNVGLSDVEDNAAEWASQNAAPLGKSPLVLSTNSGFGGVNTAIVLSAGGEI